MSTIKKVSVNGQVYDLGGSGGGTIIETTYAELKSLKDSSALVPEQKYRITDYETMTKPDEDDYISANHGFDIVVTALAESKLKSNAEVLLRDGDLYFANSKLEEWSIKYSIDNDSELYPFCDPNGKGVIYKMVDENGNTAPFDFKNIMMKVDESSTICVKNTLYFYIISYINENTNNYVSSQDYIHDATVKFDNVTNNVFYSVPQSRFSIILCKNILEDILKIHNTINGCVFRYKILIPLISSLSYVSLKNTFSSYFAVNSSVERMFDKNNYPSRIEKPSPWIPVSINSVILNNCEFNFVEANSPKLEINVNNLDCLKVTINSGNGASVTILSDKFNYSIVFINFEDSESAYGYNAYLSDDLLPPNFTDFFGCELHLLVKEKKSVTTSKVYSITSGYVIDKTGAIHQLPEFDSSLLNPEET